MGGGASPDELETQPWGVSDHGRPTPGPLREGLPSATVIEDSPLPRSSAEIPFDMKPATRQHVPRTQ